MAYGSGLVNAQAISDFVQRYLVEIILVAIIIWVIIFFIKEKGSIDDWFSRNQGG
jgi:hypothetical protein